MQRHSPRLYVDSTWSIFAQHRDLTLAARIVDDVDGEQIAHRAEKIVAQKWKAKRFSAPTRLLLKVANKPWSISEHNNAKIGMNALNTRVYCMLQSGSMLTDGLFIGKRLLIGWLNAATVAEIQIARCEQRAENRQSLKRRFVAFVDDQNRAVAHLKANNRFSYLKLAPKNFYRFDELGILVLKSASAYCRFYGQTLNCRIAVQLNILAWQLERLEKAVCRKQMS